MIIHIFLINDNLQVNLLQRYHEAVQELSADLHPVVPTADHRHQLSLSPETSNPRVMRYWDRTDPHNPVVKTERIGVHHLVHGWQQQVQPEKVCLMKDYPHHSMLI